MSSPTTTVPRLAVKIEPLGDRVVVDEHLHVPPERRGLAMGVGQNLGSSLMSAPVMGNPFANGGASLSAPRPQNLGLSQQPQQPQQEPVNQPVMLPAGMSQVLS